MNWNAIEYWTLWAWGLFGLEDTWRYLVQEAQGELAQQMEELGWWATYSVHRCSKEHCQCATSKYANLPLVTFYYCSPVADRALAEQYNGKEESFYRTAALHEWTHVFLNPHNGIPSGRFGTDRPFGEMVANQIMLACEKLSTGEIVPLVHPNPLFKVGASEIEEYIRLCMEVTRLGPMGWKPYPPEIESPIFYEGRQRGALAWSIYHEDHGGGAWGALSAQMIEIRYDPYWVCDLLDEFLRAFWRVALCPYSKLESGAPHLREKKLDVIMHGMKRLGW